MKAWAASIAALLAASPWHSSQAAELRIYRCTAGDGAVSLQDAPCARDARQEVRDLRRPVDAVAVPRSTPMRPAARPPHAPPPPDAPRAPVTPLFACQGHGGQRYENETGVGETRWVPLWVVGADPRAPRRTFVRTGATPSPPREGPRVPSTAPGPAALGPGLWLQDACHRLPDGDACARRRGQLAELRRDRRAAGAGARPALRERIARLSAQLDRECG